MNDRNQTMDFMERLGYTQGTSLSEDSLPEALSRFAELRRAGNITDYLVVSSAEFWEDPKMKESYQILVKGRK